MPNLASLSREERNTWYREYRDSKREYFREYNRKYNKKWRKENGYHSEYSWKIRNPEKVLAHHKAQYAKKIGKITLQPCEMCGSKEAVMHHDDYNKPLDVRFFCKVHHSVVHKGKKPQEMEQVSKAEFLSKK